MSKLTELINRDEPAWPIVLEWLKSAKQSCEVLPAAVHREDVLYQTQVTTRSPMGAVVYECGGILIDHGWLRFLGSGHPRLTRKLPDWNEGRANGFYLVADDVVGGFFAINGGALGDEMHKIYYFAPDSLRWEPTGMGYSDLLHWAMIGDVAKYYETMRWDGWENDTAKLSCNRCFFFYPFLWTTEGSVTKSVRKDVPVEEAWGLQMDIVRQLDE